MRVVPLMCEAIWTDRPRNNCGPYTDPVGPWVRPCSPSERPRPMPSNECTSRPAGSARRLPRASRQLLPAIHPSCTPALNAVRGVAPTQSPNLMLRAPGVSANVSIVHDDKSTNTGTARMLSWGALPSPGSRVAEKGSCKHTHIYIYMYVCKDI